MRAVINEKMTVNGLGTGDAKDVFTNIFRKNWWNSGESRSGWGAELKRTESIRAALPEFVRRHSLRSLLDAPCGDYHWMQYVEWPRAFRYIGADIVLDLIAQNRAKFPTVEFIELDVLRDPLPQVEAWLARDLMIHFPDDAVRTALKQFRNSTLRFLLATTYPNAKRNSDIKFGQVRHLNLCAPPFGLPPPCETLCEDDDPVTGRVIGVWRRSDIE
ncbi:MAG TPA: class I SAM-dependent methyltransferase [Pseudolabrys sp.]|nr:class I SAM-dependent methyltransferase [Pseudolabrys sp.]